MSIFTDKNNLILRLTFSTSENVLLCADRQHKKKIHTIPGYKQNH